MGVIGLYIESFPIAGSGFWEVEGFGVGVGSGFFFFFDAIYGPKALHQNTLNP